MISAEELDRSQRATRVRLNLTMSTSSEQLDIVFHDAVTEQDEAISSQHSELREQIPSARPVRELDKEQAETELEPSVRENLAARQQSDPEIGKLVQLCLQSSE